MWTRPPEFRDQQTVGWAQRSDHPMTPWDNASLWSALGTFFTAITCASFTPARSHWCVRTEPATTMSLDCLQFSSLLDPYSRPYILHLSSTNIMILLSTTVAHLRTLSLSICMSVSLSSKPLLDNMDAHPEMHANFS